MSVAESASRQRGPQCLPNSSISQSREAPPFADVCSHVCVRVGVRVAHRLRLCVCVCVCACLCRREPAGILPEHRVLSLPPLLVDVIDRMQARGLFDHDTRPDSCIINFYDAGCVWVPACGCLRVGARAWVPARGCASVGVCAARPDESEAHPMRSRALRSSLAASRPWQRLHTAAYRLPRLFPAVCNALAPL